VGSNIVVIVLHPTENRYISQATRVFGLRRCRYRGFAKTKLQHIITAAAMNLVRIWQWWTEANNFGKCISRFAALTVSNST
uniref:transposase n=1 Tax=Brasilonema sp. UFV-L1 TaxID=2234130 RepID=UPI0016AEC766|nr:hypothetical protein [Brasilonema sp. UFV-L1]